MSGVTKFDYQSVPIQGTTVLVVGFGKIGKIKAELWNRLGCQVIVFDTNLTQKQVIVNNGYTYLETLRADESEASIVDISTPAGTHFETLTTILESIKTPPRVILVEKPFASSRDELEKFLNILDDPRYEWLKDRLFVNEQYYSSKTLAHAKKIIGGEHITSVQVNLSKNRLEDTLQNNRFFDYQLGAFGIEIPHAIAILDILGVDIQNLRNIRSSRFVKDNEFINQGVRITAAQGKTHIVLDSYLGYFSLENGRTLIPDNMLKRTITITTATKNITITLDPHPSLERFFAHIQATSKAGESLINETIFDDHLMEHLKLFLEQKQMMSMCKLAHLSRHLELLLRLSETAPSVDITYNNLALVKEY